MQPLSYQILPSSCWVTSMLNGLLLLYGDKNKIPGLVYRLLHAVLTDEGVASQGSVRNDWKIVLDAIQSRTGLRVENFQGPEVETTLRNLNFKKQVAVCDIVAGSHSILLTGRSGGWIEVFDPDWDNVKKKREKQDAYFVQPAENKQRRAGRVNVLLAEDYLLRAGRGRKSEFQMGAVLARNLTVLEKL
ncbi:MAG: hypothetical protein WB930_21195 [Syntrophobacteraceae bacterium]